MLHPECGAVVFSDFTVSGNLNKQPTSWSDCDLIVAEWVHRNMWPQLFQLSPAHFKPVRKARIRQEKKVKYPKWILLCQIMVSSLMLPLFIVKMLDDKTGFKGWWIYFHWSEICINSHFFQSFQVWIRRVCWKTLSGACGRCSRWCLFPSAPCSRLWCHQTKLGAWWSPPQGGTAGTRWWSSPAHAASEGPRSEAASHLQQDDGKDVITVRPLQSQQELPWHHDMMKLGSIAGLMCA